MSDVLRSTMSGAVGAAAMTGMRALTVNLGLVEKTPPRAMIDKKGLFRLVPRKKRRAAIEVMHWGYGAQGGALFGLLPEHMRRPVWSGPAYGLVLWLGFELVIAPAMGLKHAKGSRPAARLAFAADHALYGCVVSEMGGRPRR